MEKSEQITHQGNQTGTTPAMFWGTIALGVIGIVAVLFTLVPMLQLPREGVVYFAMVLYTLTIVAGMTVIILTIRGHQDLGAQLAFYMVALVFISSPVIFIGRALTAFSSLLTISGIIILQLLPRALRRRYTAIAGVALILIWAVEWINPSWRLQTEVGKGGGPATAIIFGLILIVILVREAWVAGQLNISIRFTLLSVLVVMPVMVAALFFVLSRAGNNIETQGAEILAKANQSMVGNTTIWLNQQKETIDTLVNLPDIRSMQDSEQKPLLTTFKQQHANIYLVHTIGLNGMNVARSDDGKLTDYHDRAYFNSVISGSPIAFQSLIGRTTGQPAVCIAAPIQASSDRIVGVGTMCGELTEIAQSVQSVKVGNTGFSFVVDDKNQVIAHPDPTYTAALTDFSQYPPVAMLRSGKLGNVTFTDDKGIAWHAYIEQLDNGWGVITQQQDSEYLAMLTSFQLISVVTLFIGLILIAVAIWFMVRVMVHPVASLTLVAQAITNGDLTVKATEDRKDEFGVLARTFNLMTKRLQEILQGLEQRVADRTRNLQLAAEVGRTVSQVRDLDVMLKDACELILKEFNLYYVQVYLTDPSQTNLVLEAGTGDVGTQLLERSHSLQLNTGSINGRAAIEKRSVVISDSAQSPTFRQNPLLPYTRGEMAVPLIVANKVVGVLDMQSSTPGVLNNEILPAFEALAGQLAVAIQNANLLAETDQARAEVEKQARRLARTSWSEHLDAIHKPEHIGFVFDHNQVSPFTNEHVSQDANNGKTISASISVTGESLGSLVMELGDESQREQASELVDIVARQVAQQIENLRLLESAERYRYEAERAARLQTREGWQDYVRSRTAANLGYLYDSNEVRPHSNGPETSESALTLPLKTRDETVGKLSIQGVASNDSESLELANEIAGRLSAHIENLRLAEKTQDSLNWQQAINRTSILIGQAKSIEEIVRGAAELLPLLEMLSCSISVVKSADSQGIPTICDIHIVRFIKNEYVSMPPVLGQPTAGWLPDDLKYYQENRVTVFPTLDDLTTIVPSTAYKAEGAVEYMRKVGMHSAIALALGMHDRPIGYLTFTTPTPLTHGSEKYVAWLESIVDLISAAIDNQLLFEETKRSQVELDKRAQQLASVAAISTASSQELEVDKLLNTVAHLTRREFDLYHAHIFIFDEANRELKIAACGWKDGDEKAGTHETVSIPLDKEQSLVARAARGGRSVIINDVKSESGWLPNPLLPDTASEMAVPLLIGDRVLGVLDVQSDRINAFAEEDANIQTTLASQVATALQNARSFTQAQKQAERETMLNVINQKIQSATSVEAVLQIAARELGHALGAPMTIAQISMKDKSS